VTRKVHVRQCVGQAMAKIKKGAPEKQPVTVEESLPLFLKAGTGSVSLTVRAKPGSKVRYPSPYLPSTDSPRSFVSYHYSDLLERLKLRVPRPRPGIRELSPVAHISDGFARLGVPAPS
jgi:hypothetical protein